MRSTVDFFPLICASCVPVLALLSKRAALQATEFGRTRLGEAKRKKQRAA